jgi:hypothetical protein
MIRTRLVRGFGVPLLLCAFVSGCAVQFVSPYSADVQKRASDMIAEVGAWEVQMRVSAGTPQADPRHPDMTVTFARWNGEVEAMAATEAALDPHVIACDKVAAIVARGSSIVVPQPASSPAAAGASANPPASGPPQGCPAQIFQNLSSTLAELQQVVELNCELPWMTAADFQAIADAKANAGVKSTAAAAPKPGAIRPTADQQNAAAARCARLFNPPSVNGKLNPGHGVLVAPVTGQLYDIVYLETRKNTTATK